LWSKTCYPVDKADSFTITLLRGVTGTLDIQNLNNFVHLTLNFDLQPFEPFQLINFEFSIYIYCVNVNNICLIRFQKLNKN